MNEVCDHVLAQSRLDSRFGYDVRCHSFLFLLLQVYDKISFKLTDWGKFEVKQISILCLFIFIKVSIFGNIFLLSENHRTQTEYDDALIIKLFAFQFCNSYSSLYYIAFFRGEVSPVSPPFMLIQVVLRIHH